MQMSKGMYSIRIFLCHSRISCSAFLVLWFLFLEIMFYISTFGSFRKKILKSEEFLGPF